LAIQRAYFHVVRYFVEECGMKLGDDPKVFHYAALGNLKHPSMLAYLKENGGDVNHEDEKLGTPLTLGLFKSESGAVDEAFVRWLLDNGADVTHQNSGGERSSALHKAIDVGSLELVVKILSLPGTAPLLNAMDVNGRTPLIIAAEHGREDVVELVRPIAFHSRKTCLISSLCVSCCPSIKSIRISLFTTRHCFSQFKVRFRIYARDRSLL
jgi:hypothetical protein